MTTIMTRQNGDRDNYDGNDGDDDDGDNDYDDAPANATSMITNMIMTMAMMV